MNRDWSLKDVERNAEHIKALGLVEIYLSQGDMPWELATTYRPGGSHRPDIDTSVWFEGKSPSGIPLRWSFDIESRDANGKGYYKVNVAGCQEVVLRLNEPCLSAFKRYLTRCADVIDKNAREYEGIAENERATARILRSI